MRKFVFAAAAAALAAALAAGAARAQDNLPEGPGKAIFVKGCGVCHGLDVSTNLHQSPTQWQAIVSSMINAGAPVTDDEYDVLVDYLVTNYGPRKPAAPGP
jgi:mono/diheme cytochrome c family protein